MGLDLTTGIMGAGKTYKLVNDIYDKHDKYYKVYNNIQGFKYKDNMYELSLVNLLVLIKQMKHVYTSSGDDDNAVIDLLLERDIISRDDDGKIISTWVVVDEAQKRLGKDFECKEDNNLFVWFITLHRHFFFDVSLITQSFKLINPLLHSLVEVAYHAIPESRVIKLPFAKDKFKYQKHMAVPYSFDTKFGDLFIVKRKEVFDMYTSGDSVRQKSLVNNAILLILSGVVAVGFLFFYFFNYRMDKKSTVDTKVNYIDTQTDININTNKRNIVHSIEDYSNMKYISLNCISRICTNHEFNISLSLVDLEILLVGTGSKLLRYKKYSSSFKVAYILSSDSFLNLFKKRNKNVLKNPIYNIR